MKRKSEIFKFIPQQWYLKAGEVEFCVRGEEGVGYYLSFRRVELESNYICIRYPFKTIGGVEKYILETFGIDTSFSS